MNREEGLPETLRVVLTPEQISRRVQDMGRNITEDFQGSRLIVVIVENGFVFAADLIRAIDLPVAYQFVLSNVREIAQGVSKATEIFYYPQAEVKNENVLLVMGLVQSGLTCDFLVRNLQGHGAASVKVAALLDRQSARRVPVQPDYFGFLIDEGYVVGYGLGAPSVGRNLPYVATFTPPVKPGNPEV